MTITPVNFIREFVLDDEQQLLPVFCEENAVIDPDIHNFEHYSFNGSKNIKQKYQNHGLKNTRRYLRCYDNIYIY